MKYIYLDQNIWIELAKGILQGSSGTKMERIINKMRAKIENGEWAFPLSLIHYIETSKRLNDRTRQELAGVMGYFSKNYTVAPFLVYKSDEFFVSLQYLDGLISDKLSMKNKIIKPDIANMFGMDFNDFEITSELFVDDEKKSMKNDFLQFIKNNDMFSRSVANLSSEKNATNLQKDAEFYAKYYEEARNQLHDAIRDKHKKYRYRGFLLKYFMVMFDDELRLLHSNALEKNIDAIFPKKTFKNYESTMNFLCAAPSFHVNATLTYEIMNDKHRKLSGNDYFDISFLSTAIPYCDVVVTERSWTSIAKKYKLDTTYDTKIFSKIDDLLQC